MKTWKSYTLDGFTEHVLRAGAFTLEVYARIGTDPTAKAWECNYKLADNEPMWVYSGAPLTLVQAQARVIREVKRWLRRQQKALS